MKFLFLRDGLFQLCCSLYAANRWLIIPRTHSAFLRFHFNDLLLIPCALPPLLFTQRWLRLRSHSEPPRAGEIALHLAVWSALFELIGPCFFSRATADGWDVVAYIVGGIAAGLWWNRHALTFASRHEL